MPTKKDPPKKRLSFNDFDIRTKSEEGVKVTLMDPNTGQMTDEWLKVIGDDSEAYRLAQAEFNAKRLDFIRDKKNKGDIKAGLKFDTESERDLVAALIVDWSLVDEKGDGVPCTKENVVKFLTSAPQIQDQVSSFAGNRKNFSNPSSAN